MVRIKYVVNTLYLSYLHTFTHTGSMSAYLKVTPVLLLGNKIYQYKKIHQFGTCLYIYVNSNKYVVQFRNESKRSSTHERFASLEATHVLR